MGGGAFPACSVLRAPGPGGERPPPQSLIVLPLLSSCHHQATPGRNYLQGRPAPGQCQLDITATQVEGGRGCSAQAGRVPACMVATGMPTGRSHGAFFLPFTQGLTAPRPDLHPVCGTVLLPGIGTSCKCPTGAADGHCWSRLCLLRARRHHACAHWSAMHCCVQPLTACGQTLVTNGTPGTQLAGDRPVPHGWRAQCGSLPRKYPPSRPLGPGRCCLHVAWDQPWLCRWGGSWAPQWVCPLARGAPTSDLRVIIACSYSVVML